MHERLIEHLGLPGAVTATFVTGGDVNEAYELVDGNHQHYFLLVQPGYGADFYQAEIAGLRLFQKYAINAPQVLANGEYHGDAYLLLSYIDTGVGSQRDLGRLVAHLHQHNNPTGKFGFDYPYRGTTISFTNTWTTSWEELFVDQRLLPLGAKLQRSGFWKPADYQLFMRAVAVIRQSLQAHLSQPALCHGDLWIGNVMFDQAGQPALIDPSPLYGDREFDIGITQVFGGFEPEFYAGYNEVFPLEPGAEDRLEFYRLYLLMIHLNKFGTTYYNAVNASLHRVIVHEKED